MPADLPVLAIAEQKSPADWLAAAATQAPAERQKSLLLAAALWQQQQQWQRAAALLSQLDVPLLSQADRLQYQLLQAQFAAHQQQWSTVLEWLRDLTVQFSDATEKAQALSLQAQAAAAQGNFLQAALWRIEQQRYQPQQVSTDTIWTLLQRVDERTSANAALPSDTVALGWLRLLQVMHASLDDGTPTGDVLQAWQQGYPDHPAQALVNQWLAQPELTPLGGAQRVVVLLPLSGPFGSQGTAVRDGILMGLLQRDVPLEARFIDTHQTALPEIFSELQVSPPEYVIGPLLKPQVEAWQQALQTQPARWQQLFLNEPPVTQSAALSPSNDRATELSMALPAYFALDAETEIRLGADYLYRQGKQNPLVLSPAHDRGDALTETFAAHWRRLPVADPSIASGSYRTTEDMKAAVQLNLGVADSERRITDVKYAAGKIIVEAEARSRADIDAIYLTGSADQTKLLKPFIDVNIAPFAQRIPVYATSASHVRQNSMSENDLHQVTFSEAPWLLPSHSEYEQVQQILKLRDGWGYSQARLVAMGRDAVQLVPVLDWLAKLPGYRWHGYSGRLQMVNQRLIRQLSWATFNQYQVVPIKGEQDVPTATWSGL